MDNIAPRMHLTVLMIYDRVSVCMWVLDLDKSNKVTERKITWGTHVRNDSTSEKGGRNISKRGKEREREIVEYISMNPLIFFSTEQTLTSFATRKFDTPEVGYSHHSAHI